MTQSTINPYPKTDYGFFIKMCKVVYSTKRQQDEIFRLYNKYVGKMSGYSTTCNCSTSIANLWGKSRDWFVKNGKLFEW